MSNVFTSYMSSVKALNKLIGRATTRGKRYRSHLSYIRKENLPEPGMPELYNKLKRLPEPSRMKFDSSLTTGSPGREASFNVKKLKKIRKNIATGRYKGGKSVKFVIIRGRVVPIRVNK